MASGTIKNTNEIVNLELTDVPSTATEAEMISNIGAQLQAALTSHHILSRQLILGDVTWTSHYSYKIMAERFSDVTYAIRFQVYASNGEIYNCYISGSGGVSARLHAGTVVS